MKNINMNLNGNIVVVEVIGFDEYELLGYELIEALNQEGILPELVEDGMLEVANHGDGEYQIGYAEYKVFEGYEDAYNTAVEYEEMTLDECGLTDDLINIADINGFIEGDWFKDCWEEIHYSQAYEEGLEYIATEEEMEQLEDGTTNEDAIRDNFYEGLQSSIAGQEMEEYRYQFGDEEFQNAIINNGLIDLNELAKYCVDCDGVGHALAHYDGDEINMDDLYAYRVN